MPLCMGISRYVNYICKPFARCANPAFRSLASLVTSRPRRRRHSAQFAHFSSHAPSRSLLRPRLGPYLRFLQHPTDLNRSLPSLGRRVCAR